jgi:hypothetical protein
MVDEEELRNRREGEQRRNGVVHNAKVQLICAYKAWRPPHNAKVQLFLPENPQKGSFLQFNCTFAG